MLARVNPRFPVRIAPLQVACLAGLVVASAGCSTSLSLPADGQPAALAVVSGDRQRGRAGAALANPLVVQLTDALGRPVMGATVAFRFLSPPSGGKVNGTAITDSSGHATATVVLASAAGTQQVEAHVDGPASDPRATFTLDATAAPPPSNPGTPGSPGTPTPPRPPTTPTPPGNGGGQGGNGDHD
jgi:hypothetical protein